MWGIASPSLCCGAARGVVTIIRCVRAILKACGHLETETLRTLLKGLVDTSGPFCGIAPGVNIVDSNSVVPHDVNKTSNSLGAAVPRRQSRTFKKHMEIKTDPAGGLP